MIMFHQLVLFAVNRLVPCSLLLLLLLVLLCTVYRSAEVKYCSFKLLTLLIVQK